MTQQGGRGGEGPTSREFGNHYKGGAALGGLVGESVTVLNPRLIHGKVVMSGRLQLKDAIFHFRGSRRCYEES